MSETLQKLNQFDLDLTDWIRLKSTAHLGWKLAAILAHSGDSWLWATGLGLVWLFSFGRQPLHRASAIFEISIVVQALTVFALKMLIRRRRPSGEWGGIYRHYDPHSFPSGHATRATMLAVLGLALGPAWFGWLLVAWAPLVCLARVMTGLHFVSDIFAGIVLGLLMGLVMIAVNPLMIQSFPFLF
jgi:membrane-associated phospholipid phosphatase